MEIPGLQNQQLNNLTNAPKVAVDQPVMKRSEVVAEPVKVASVEKIEINVKTADEKRLSAIKDSLREAFKNVYAVSDKTVTIYKDMSGQYITRYKDLRSGTMTYIPEPEILKNINSGGYFSLNA